MQLEEWRWRQREKEREGGRERAIEMVPLTPLVIALHEHMPLTEHEVEGQLSLRRLDSLRPLLEHQMTLKVIAVFTGIFHTL